LDENATGENAPDPEENGIGSPPDI